jgi:hydroxymethylpyrimidine kinase/phosphomethylpyrimidine kinase/thiamine-phosphate diphosphorylase
MNTAPPIVWSIAGTDSGGGAGLSADQRAADAFGVHLCPVVAAVTAQHSLAVEHVEPLRPELLDAQLAALADDLPPTVIKTGLLGSAANVERVAAWIDRLRERRPVALVVDPVLGASTGRSFADDTLLQAYRQHLLPRTTLLTPNRAEAARLLGPVAPDLPQQAAALREAGCQAVALTGGDHPALHGDVLDWIDTPQARGWLALPRVDTRHTHGTGCTFASSAAAALALGFTPADAAVLAKMATTHALRHGREAGAGAGPVVAGVGFGTDPALMPRLSWGEAARFMPLPTDADPSADLGLYALLDDAERTPALLALGVRLLQLRLKTARPPREAVQRFITHCRAAGAMGYVNDHWQLAMECGAQGVHLGQEDLLALGDDGRDALLASGLALGISSHSLWELARARALAPRYIACGPVWPTETKAMPWRPQGLDNLAWWCTMAGAPVVAIGGLLHADQFEAAARSGPAAACAVRVIGDRPERTVPLLQLAWQRGRTAPRRDPPALPHPML